MYQLAKIMALFWTVAEGALLLYLRWGYLKLRGGDSGQREWIILCSVIFSMLALWMLAGEALVHEWLPDIRHVKLYRWGMWNFFCTLFVGLEGVIMIYVIRIHGLLRSRTGSGGRRSPGAIMWPLFALFAFYHFTFFQTALNHALSNLQIYHVSVFYIRICGLFWILFEWVVAVYGFKTYGLLREGAKAAHARS